MGKVSTELRDFTVKGVSQMPQRKLNCPSLPSLFGPLLFCQGAAGDSA